jgi:hypothetical protein
MNLRVDKFPRHRVTQARFPMKSPRLAVAQFRFSSDDLAEDERLAAWREIFSRTVVGLEIEPLGRRPFHSEATVCQLPALGVLSAACSAMRLDHTRQLIGDDDLSFMAAPTCRWSVSQLGRNLGSGRATGSC